MLSVTWIVCACEVLVGASVAVVQEAEVAAEQTPQEGAQAAQEVPPIPEMFVIGRLGPEGVPEVPFTAVGSRDVLGPEELARIGARDLNDLVKYLPALSTRPYNGGEASAPSFSTRGLPDDGLTEYVLVLIDGVPANPLPYGWTAFSFLPLVTEQVYAVDLIRGAQAVRYSPNTVGGVLNLITPPIPDQETTSMQSTVGENGYSSTVVSYGDRAGDFGFLLTVGDRRGDGYREDGEFAQRSVDLKLQWETDPGSWIAARLSYMDDFHKAPGGLTVAQFEQDRFANARPRNEFEGFRWVADVVRHTASDDGWFEAFAWVSQTRRELEAQRPHFGVADTFLRWTDDSFVAAAGVRSEKQLSSEHTLLWGLRAQQEVLPSWEMTTEQIGVGTATPMRDSEYTLTALSAHVDDTFRPTERLEITAGVRAEWIPVAEGQDDVMGGDFDDEFFDLLPGVGASYMLNDRWVLFGNYHQSFRAPQVWGFDLNAVGAQQDVDFEHGDSFELGTRVLGPGGTEGSLTAWRTDIDDVGVFYTGVYENIGRIVAEGLDASLSWEAGEALEVLDGFSTRLSWTLQDSTLREGIDAGNDTPYAWKSKGAWSLQYLTRERWRLSLGGVYIGDSYSDEANTAAENANGNLGRNPASTVWDAQVEKHWSAGAGAISLALGASNVFDEDWFVHSRGGFFGGGKVSGPPRQVYLRFRASF